MNYTNATVATPSVSFTYEASYPRMATMVDGVGTTAYSYNPIPAAPTLGAGRLGSIDGPLGSDTITYAYDELGRVLNRAIDGANNTSSAVYDALGRVTGVTNPLGAFTLAYVNATGRLDHVLYPNGQRTNYAYFNNAGDQRLAQIRNLKSDLSNLSTFTYTYDALGNVLTVALPPPASGLTPLVTTYAYDHRNRVTSVTEPTGAATTYTYDANSNVLTSTDALGKVTAYAYDGEDRLKTVTLPAPGSGLPALVTIYNYDDAGRLTSVVAPGSLTTTTAYDSRGLLTGVTDPLSRTSLFTYDDLSRRLTAKDPLNRTTSFAYDALNRLRQVTDPGTLVAEQGFDADGNRTSLKNPAGNAAAFVYAAGSRLTNATTPEGHVTGYTYNSRDLLASVTEPSGQATSLAYDDAQRLSGTTDPVGTINITRDAVGRVLTITENGKTLTRVYDLLGRLTSYTDGDGNTIGYQYDDIGRLTKLIYPDGKQVAYAYDNAGRLSTVTDWANRVTTYSYDAVSRLTQTLRPNGTKQTRTYDDAGQLTQLVELAPDGITVIYSGTHSYDLAGQLTNETLAPGIAPVTVNATQTFDADNRLLTHNGAATTFDVDGNLLSVASGLSPSAYTYDARNRLISSGGLSYGYNVENRRVSITDSIGTTRFAVNPNAVLDQVVVKTAPDGTKTFYVYGLGLLHEETNGVPRFYHFDRRGDTVALTDNSGAVTGRVSYGVYGEILNRTGATDTTFLFNGQWGVQTDISGIYYHRARYYHPQLRRFLNQDILLGAIEEARSLNRFAYTSGDPISEVDPLGLETWGVPMSMGQAQGMMGAAIAQQSAGKGEAARQVALANSGIRNVNAVISAVNVVYTDPMTRATIGGVKAVSGVNNMIQGGITAGAGVAATVTIPGVGRVAGPVAVGIGVVRIGWGVNGYIGGMIDVGKGLSGKGYGPLPSIPEIPSPPFKTQPPPVSSAPCN